MGLTRALLGGLTALALSAAAPAVRGDTPAYAIKAAYLYKFAPFVGWPSTAFASPSSPFRLCILGDDPFGAILDQAVSGHTVDDHPIEVLRVQSADAASGCHILYFNALRNAAMAETFNHLRGSPVLTVTEENSAHAEGVIQFVIRDGHVRFAIDATAAAANGVTISSKLLSLAVPLKTGF